MTRPQRCIAVGCYRMGSWQIWIAEKKRHVWMCDKHHAETAKAAPEALINGGYEGTSESKPPVARQIPKAPPNRRRGVMNATERAWAAELEADPLVKSFRFEEVTFTVGGGEHGKRPKRYTPDFLVGCAGYVDESGVVVGFAAVSVIEVHEVKGNHGHRRRGVETLKAAAKQYPEFRWFLVEKAEDGSWRKVPIE